LSGRGPLPDGKVLREKKEKKGTATLFSSFSLEGGGEKKGGGGKRRKERPRASSDSFFLCVKRGKGEKRLG